MIDWLVLNLLGLAFCGKAILAGVSLSKAIKALWLRGQTDKEGDS